MGLIKISFIWRMWYDKRWGKLWKFKVKILIMILWKKNFFGLVYFVVFFEFVESLCIS